MRVLLLNTWERSGGAARAAHRLHRALRTAVVDSRMLVLHRESADAHVLPAPLDPHERRRDAIWSAIDDRWIRRNRTDRSDTWFSSGWPGRRLETHPWVTAADVLHLHWIPGLLRSADVAALLALGKPVVWTLHDEWAFTGGCHYSSGCERWRTRCGACPQVRADPHGYVESLFLDKRHDLVRGDLTVVTPSRWLAERAKASAILGGRPVQVIPNSVEIDRFTPALRDEGRRAIGCRPGEAVILFSATSLHERRKGFAELRLALDSLAADPRMRARLAEGSLRLVTMGVPDADPVAIPVTHRGVLSDDREIAAMMAAADVCAIPSLEDNLPNSALEAMACGTAVVAFATGGLPEAIGDHPAHATVPTGDVAALAGALARSLESVEIAGRRDSIRSHAERRFSPAVQAAAHCGLYSGLLASAR